MTETLGLFRLANKPQGGYSVNEGKENISVETSQQVQQTFKDLCVKIIEEVDHITDEEAQEKLQQNVEDLKKIVEDTAENPSPPVDLLKGIGLLITKTDRYIDKKCIEEFEKVEKNKNDVKALHELRQEINKNTNSKGELDLNNPRGIELIKKAKELGIVFKDKNGKLSFTKEEREYLIEAIEMTIKDLNIQSQLQMQTLSRLTNLRYEFHQLARLIEKRIDECLKQVIKGIAL